MVKEDRNLILLALILMGISCGFLIYFMYIVDFVLMWVAFYVFGMTYTFILIMHYGEDIKNKLKYSIIFSVIFPITWIIRLFMKGKNE
jgi:uncharacterized membrane protein YesL